MAEEPRSSLPAAGQGPRPESTEPFSFLGRHDRAALAIALVLLAGIALRVALAFPPYKYRDDGDSVLAGMCAERVLAGKYPLFFSPGRIGALGGYLAALLFAWFGENRAALAAGPVIVGALQLIVWYLFLRELLGSKLALIAVPFAAALSPAAARWMLQPNGYPEIMLLCSTTLWLASRVARGDESHLTVIGLWLSIGLAGWQSLLTLGCSLPALAWLSWRRPGLWRRRRWLLLATGAALLAAFPWIAFHLAVEQGEPQANAVAIRPAPGIPAMVDNLGYVLSHDLRELVASTSVSASWLQTRLLWLVLAVHLAAAVYFFVAAAPAWRGRALLRGPAAPPLAAAWLLCALLVLGVVVLKVISSPGGMRGPTERYLLPIALLVPVMLAVSCARLARAGALGKAAAWTLAAAVVVFDLAGVALPGTPVRQRCAARAVSDERLLARLRRERIEAIAGSYWLVYPIDWLSHHRILGPAMEPLHDHYNIAAQIPDRGLRWALIAGEPDQLRRWTECARLTGLIETVDPFYSVFRPQPNPPVEPGPAFLQRVTMAYRFTSLPGPPPGSGCSALPPAAAGTSPQGR
jgi:hypothetical protein